MQVDGRLSIVSDKETYRFIATLQTSGSLSIVKSLFISLFEGLMFSCWIVTNITSARGTVHYRTTRIPCGDQLVICGQVVTAVRT
jgi:hypothetical protein